VEAAKLQLAEGGDRAYYTAMTLARVLDTCLRLLHPFTPFITEELWGHLRHALQESALSSLMSGWSQALIITAWPEVRPIEGWEDKKVAEFTLIQEIVRSIRNLRSEKNVTPGKKLPATFAAGEWHSILVKQAASIAMLAQLDLKELKIVHTLKEKPASSVVLVVGPVEIYLPMAELVNVNEERARLEKDLEEAENQISRLENLLSSAFAEKAPAAVVQKERDKLTGFMETADKLRLQLLAME
jgi:valyl-tRNA synthetase